MASRPNLNDLILSHMTSPFYFVERKGNNLRRANVFSKFNCHGVKALDLGK